MYLVPASLDLGLYTVVGDQHVEAKAQQLERDVSGEEFAGRRHQHHGQDSEHQDAVVLARVFEVSLNVIDTRNDGDGSEHEEESLEKQSVVVYENQAFRRGCRPRPTGTEARKS